MSNEQESELDRLVKHVAALELSNQQLSQQIEALRLNTQAAHLKSKQVSTAIRSNVRKVAAAHLHREVYLDRLGREIDLGDTIYIIMPGAHTSRSRRGTVSGFNKHRNRVFILDEARITQERSPKNVRIENHSACSS